jgi:hypothetical protein
MVIKDDGEIFSCDLTPHGKQRKIFTTREPLMRHLGDHPVQPSAQHGLAQDRAGDRHQQLRRRQADRTDADDRAWCWPTFYEAGLPPEMLSVVTGWPSDIGDEMITNPNIDLITFTGGVPVGKLIAAKAGYKRQVLELGGNDPLIILNDLRDDDLARAADLAVAGATKNSGQRCTAVKRILVQESIADRFVPLVLERAKKLKFGDLCSLDRSRHRRARTCRQDVRRPRPGPPNRGGRAHHPGRQRAAAPHRRRPRQPRLRTRHGGDLRPGHPDRARARQ